MTACRVCGAEFEPQFRFQAEAVVCSQKCHAESLDGDVACDVCSKRFHVELLAQMLHVGGTRRYACSDGCRDQLLAQKTLEMTPPAMAAVEEDLPPVLRPRRAALQRIAIFNHKGGTGKTTTCVTIAAGLAARGLKVLVVDTDAQGNVACSLGIKPERTLYHVLVMGLPPHAAAVNVRSNLDVIASNETLAAAELYLAGRQNRDRVLRERLEETSQYDVVLLDCSPSLSLLNQNALVFADGIA